MLINLRHAHDVRSYRPMLYTKRSIDIEIRPSVCNVDLLWVQPPLAFGLVTGNGL